MTCWLCGHEGEDSHNLGCARQGNPDMTKDEARKRGLMPAPPHQEVPPPANVQVLRDGSMTTVPVDEDQGQDPAVPDTAGGPAEIDDQPEDDGDETVEQCEVEGCDNPKYSTSARAKYCAEHKDPKNR